MRISRTWMMLSVALLAGLLAVLLASRWLDAKSGSGMTKVVVAATDISLGQRLAPELLQVVDWPARSIPPGAFSNVGELDGRVLRTNLQRGEPLLLTKLAPVGTQGGLSAVIGEGRRAITVRVNDVIGVAGFALPGNYVDIIVNTQRDAGDANARDKSISKIVLERILVLAVAQEVSRDETRPRVVNAVTLEVTPEQAEKIDLARSVGTLSLVLRNQIDPQASDTNGATKTSLLQQVAEPPHETQQAQINARNQAPSNQIRRAAKPASRKSSTAAKASDQLVASSATAGAAKSPNPPAVASSMTCVGVINGLRNGQECY
ncbi:MAG: Flp pilus assembly protein CpaB [Burkholderiaceae bacterium]